MHLHRRKSDGYLYAIHRARPDEPYTAVPVNGSYPQGALTPPIVHFEVWDAAEWDPEAIAVTSRFPNTHYSGQPGCDDISEALGKLHSALEHFVRDLHIETLGDCARLGDDQAIRLATELLRAKCTARWRDTDTEIVQILAGMCHAYACSSGSLRIAASMTEGESEEAVALGSLIADMDRLVTEAHKYTVGVRIAPRAAVPAATGGAE